MKYKEPPTPLVEVTQAEHLSAALLVKYYPTIYGGFGTFLFQEYLPKMFPSSSMSYIVASVIDVVEGCSSP